MDEKYKIEETEVSIDEVNMVRKYDLAYRPPLQSDHDYCDSPNFTRALHGFSEFKQAVISYIAGFVGKTLSNSILCYDCNEALGSQNGPSFSTFITLKDRGPLFKPSKSLIKICEETEIRFQRMLNCTLGKLPKGTANY